MTVTVLLVHPPLLGPAAWRPCAERLTAAGHRVILPDLRAALDPPAGWWDRAAATAVAGVRPAGVTSSGVESPGVDGSAVNGAGVEGAGVQGAGVGGPVVVVGHSGAGVLLPQVAARLAAVRSVVFVDALVPAETGASVPSARFRGFVAGLPVTDGRLPPWTTWWGPDVLAELVPDAALRAAIQAEERGLRPEFYDESVPVPASWPPPRVGYLQLSPGYDTDAADAATRGWAVRSLPGRHLDHATRPDEVVPLIAELAGLHQSSI